MAGNQQKRIGCIGSGRLRQAVQSALSQEYQLFSLSREELVDQAPGCSLILYCDDQWHFQAQKEINQQCLAMGIPWLRAYCEFGVGIVGPYVFPAEAGCMVCAEIRRMLAMDDPAHYLALRQSSDEDKQTREQPWLTSNSLEMLAQLVVQEVSTCQQNPDRMKTRQAQLHLKLDTLLCRRHHFLPEPECSACGRLPQDTAEAAVITLQTRPKLEPYTYRTRSLTAHAEALFEEYVDTEMGLISSLVKSPHASIAVVTARVGISNDREGLAWASGCGRALNYEQSQLIAITEAIERYGGHRPKGKRTAIQACYRELGDQALDPTTLGLHTAEQYALPDYMFVPYHHDLTCRWVWGYSFQRQKPLLVPESVAYYGQRRFVKENIDPSFVYEISNGCALGNSLEEAIFHGISEVAERDAFLLTWYAQLALPRLDPLSATDPTIGLLIENMEQTTGYTISVFNSTLDHGLPCCWVMAVDEQDRDGMAKALCGAGSHPHPERAVINALLELASMFRHQQDRFRRDRAAALEMLVDPMAVKTMEDHSFLYYLPEAFERLNFLFDSQQLVTFQEAFGDFYRRPACLDLRDDLSALIDHYLKLGIDTIVVDQTAPEHAAQGFHCVKILMPGTLSMTFGHQYRRMNGFQRLSHVPYQLGYRTRPLADAEINPHPHPFP
jgi:ribosomal protein S12 methylthiotransferase accessory factor